MTTVKSSMLTILKTLQSFVQNTVNLNKGRQIIYAGTDVENVLPKELPIAKHCLFKSL